MATFLPFPFYRKLEQKSTLWQQHHKEKERALGQRKCCSRMKPNLRYLDFLFHNKSKSVYSAAVLLLPLFVLFPGEHPHQKKTGKSALPVADDSKDVSILFTCMHFPKCFPITNPHCLFAGCQLYSHALWWASARN